MKKLLNWKGGYLLVVSLFFAVGVYAEGNRGSSKNVSSNTESTSAAFYKYDADRDGFIGRGEASQTKSLGQSFDDIDTDRDGRISAYEFEKFYPSANVDAADTNPDRSIKQAISDAWVTAKVKSALLADDQVKGLQVNVDTSKGAVTLKGEAENVEQVSKAGKVASGIEGVQKVNNQLTLKKAIKGDASQAEKRSEKGQSAREVISDSAVTTKVKAALLADKDVKGLQVNVDTEQGVVTLKGEVESQQQARKAAKIASGIEGVSTVHNDLTVKK